MSDGTPAIYLARHGQTDENVAPRRFQGHLGSRLNAEGRRQAARLAEAAADLGLRHLYSSNLVRALETASIVSGAVGIDVTIDPRLAEGSRGRWEGLLMEEVEAAEPVACGAWKRADTGFRFPCGESLVEHRERALAVVGDLSSLDGPVLAVTHGGTMRMVELFLRDLPITSFHELTGAANCEIRRLSPGEIDLLSDLRSRRA